MTGEIKLTRIQERDIAKMTDAGHFSPWAFSSTTISRFKRLGLIEHVRLDQTVYILTDAGRELAQMVVAK